MKRRKDIYLVGYCGSGGYNGACQPVYGQPLRDDTGGRQLGGGQCVRPLSLQEAQKEINELSTKAPKAIYKLVIVKKLKR